MKCDRVVLVTGAGGGIGALIAERFLAHGDIVIATDLDATALADLATRNGAAAARLHTVAADISDEEDCARLAKFARQQAGRIDVLVNCAGYFPSVAFEEMTTAQWRRIIDINLTGVFLVVKALLPLIQGRGWGRIVNIGSASVFLGVAAQAHYVAAKAGVIGFSRSLARALGKNGITVNVVTPGLTMTPVVKDHLPADFIAAQVKARAIQREQAPGDLVGAVFFLASPDADFMTGQTINVDGGRHML